MQDGGKILKIVYSSMVLVVFQLFIFVVGHRETVMEKIFCAMILDGDEEEDDDDDDEDAFKTTANPKDEDDDDDDSNEKQNSDKKAEDKGNDTVAGKACINVVAWGKKSLNKFIRVEQSLTKTSL